MTQWGIDTLFNPGKRHMDEEKRRLQSTREEIGDSSGGKRIDLESGKVRLNRRDADEAAEDTPAGEDTPADGIVAGDGSSADDTARNDTARNDTAGNDTARNDTGADDEDTPAARARRRRRAANS